MTYIFFGPAFDILFPDRSEGIPEVLCESAATFERLDSVLLV